MLISKFNKLIRNKVVWAAFAVIVSLSMVGFFAPQPTDRREQRRDGAGTLFGETVSRDAFARARLFAQAFQPLRGGEDIRQLVDEEAWRRLAALRYAEKLGLRVSNAEVVQSIQSDPSFQDNGSFSMSLYRALIEQQLGIPVEWFEEYIRQEILMDRLRDFLQTSLWVPSSELAENAARFTDTYAVSFVVIPPDVDFGEVEVGEEDARAIYASTPELFMVPEKRQVVFAAFAHADYLDPEQITERQIEMRYELDAQRFIEVDPETDEERTLALEEVADEIRAELAEQEAMSIASEHAMQLVDELSLLDNDVMLAAVARDMGFGVSTSAWFEATGSVLEGISAGSAFAQTAFRLSATNPSESFSFSVPGTNAVYVMQLHDVAEEFVLAFEDVRDEAMALARQNAEEAALQEYVVALHARLAQRLKDGESFADAAEAEELTVTEIRPFTLYDADPRDIPFFGDLAPDLLPLTTGEMTPPVSTMDGQVIAFVTNREEGSLQERVAIKPDIARMMVSGLESIHFQVWNDKLLERARE